MSDWKPIETAPRGEHILFFPTLMKNGRVQLGAMIKVDRFPVGYPRQPTHWMPLPPPPKTEPTT